MKKKRSPNSKKGHYRKSYTRSDGTYVKGGYVKAVGSKTIRKGHYRKSYTRSDGTYIKGGYVKSTRKSCPKGEVLREGSVRKGYTRKGYKRSDGTRVKGSKVSKGVIQDSCIKDLGKKGKGFQGIGEGIGRLEKGKLSQFGYHVYNTEHSRHIALGKAVKEYGALSVFRKLNAVYVLNKNTNPKLSRKFLRDRDWVQVTYDV